MGGASGSYSAVTLVDPADVIDKVAYVLANPVKAGLVRTGAKWPGLWSTPGQIGEDPSRSSFRVTVHAPKARE